MVTVLVPIDAPVPDWVTGLVTEFPDIVWEYRMDTCTLNGRSGIKTVSVSPAPGKSEKFAVRTVYQENTNANACQVCDWINLYLA